MRKELIIGLWMIMYCGVFAQKKDTIPTFSGNDFVITNLQKDSIKERDRSSNTLRALRNGAIIIRLKTNQRSIDAYKKMGRNDIAANIEAGLKKHNQLIYNAFKNNLTFCRVYFIRAADTKLFFEGRRDIFLNDTLAPDPHIVFNDTNYVFCEFGSAIPFSDFKDIALHTSGYNTNGVYQAYHSDVILDTLPIKTTTDPSSSNSFVFFDKNLVQLQRPFPYVESVYIENYNYSVKTIDRELTRAYNRLVINRDMHDAIKQERKRQRQKMKELENGSNKPH